MLIKADNLGLNRARTDDGQPDELSRPVCHCVIDAVLGAMFISKKGWLREKESNLRRNGL